MTSRFARKSKPLHPSIQWVRGKSKILDQRAFMNLKKSFPPSLIWLCTITTVWTEKFSLCDTKDVKRDFLQQPSKSGIATRQAQRRQSDGLVRNYPPVSVVWKWAQIVNTQDKAHVSRAAWARILKALLHCSSYSFML